MTMSYLLLLGVLLLAATSQSETLDTRIVGGEDTIIENYPSLVQLEYLNPYYGTWSQDCAANILTTYWVLTAAHCFVENDRVEFMRIRAGSTYRMTGGSVHYIDLVRNHPDYGVAIVHDADISVMKLLTPVVYSPYIQKGTIARQGFVVPDNYPVVHAGWGGIYTNGPSSYILQHVQIYTINREVCARRYGDGVSSSITDNMICAGILDVGGRDACQGDSGGPLYADDVIIGISSFGNNCGDPYHPGVSASVAAFSDWIIANAR
ncbi:trypsin, alkaline B-like [Colias croceus]|uniref:trypsin, alkaline B-like n=1 Tax=Colias crocea TaxID=72248 RepID=UPI001E27C8B4|nr:trypsin, alkaline B-like [Colias croceus]